MPELWIASERELVGSGSGWKDVFPSLRHPQRSQARKRQHSKLDQRSSYVLECFRHAGALDRARAGTRCKWERLGGRVPEPMSSIAVASAQAPALQTWVTRRLCFGVLPACRSFGSRRNGNTWHRSPNPTPYPTPRPAQWQPEPRPSPPNESLLPRALPDRRSWCRRGW